MSVLSGLRGGALATLIGAGLLLTITTVIMGLPESDDRGALPEPQPSSTSGPTVEFWVTSEPANTPSTVGVSFYYRGKVYVVEKTPPWTSQPLSYRHEDNVWIRANATTHFTSLRVEIRVISGEYVRTYEDVGKEPPLFAERAFPSESYFPSGPRGN